MKRGNGMNESEQSMVKGTIRKEIVFYRPLKRAELNVRRVVGITIIAAIVGALCGWLFPLDAQHQPSSKVENLR